MAFNVTFPVLSVAAPGMPGLHPDQIMKILHFGFSSIIDIIR